MINEDQTHMKLRQSHDQQDDNISSDRSEKEIKLKNPMDHRTQPRHDEISRNPDFRSCFSLRERMASWFGNIIRCSNTDNSFVEHLSELQRGHPITIPAEFKKMFENKIVKLKVIETSRLELDPNVMHPFVKVHVVNITNGCYLRRDVDMEKNMVYHQEKLTFFDRIDKKYDASSNDIILPFATACSDFRLEGNSRGRWNQKFYINYPADQFFQPTTLLLFELLDFNHQALLYRDTGKFDKENFYRVAWGYLRPTGMSRVHTGQSKIQLFRYKYNNKSAQQRKTHIPSVYYDFIWNNHEKYDGFLNVQINYTAQPKYKFIPDDQPYPTNLFQQQRQDKKYLDKFIEVGQQKIGKIGPKFNEKMLKFQRNRDICEIPKQLIYKLQSNKLGCYRAKFIGDRLFAACSEKKYTSIKVYALQDGEQVMNLKGHREMIYCMEATPNSKYLITGGSDYLVRVWEIPDDVGQFIDEDQSQSYIKGQCLHTAAVYSLAVIHMPVQDKIWIMTCCYDGFLRLWQVDLINKISKIDKEILINNYQRFSSKVYPTACATDSNYFIVGDSKGDIRIFDFAHETINEKSLLTHEQLHKDIVMNIKILNKNHILVQSGDNLIRHFEISHNRLKIIDKFVGAQFQNKICQFAVSPDNRYIICPSESGQIFLWETNGRKLSTQHLNLAIKGPLTVCDWHSRYNLVLIGGFIDMCPIFVYGNILSPGQVKMISAQLAHQQQ